MTKQWNEMTTAEKNLAIAKLVYPEERITEKNGDYGVWISVDGSHPHTGEVAQFLHWQPIPDYCNNWNDLMPLVVENEIDLCCLGKMWSADYYDADYAIRGKNKIPQEALCECLWMVLKLKGDE